MLDISEVLNQHAMWLEDNRTGVRANLSYANLSGANLSGAKGFIMLPVGDYRGHASTHAILCYDGWHIRAGCRDFTLQEARNHWNEDNHVTPEDLKMQYLAACDYVERESHNHGGPKLC